MTRVKFVTVAVWQAAMALALLLAPDQWTSPSYAVLFAISPPWVHGLCWLAGCVATVWAVKGTWNSQRWALAIAFGLSLSWALAFLGAFLLGQLAGWSGPATWTYVSARLMRDLLLVPREANGTEG